MRRSRAPSIAPGTFFVAQSWADCITNMAGFNLRQANQIELTSDFGAKTNGGSLDAEVVYINTSVDVDLLQGRFADASSEHIINGIGPTTLATTELQQINSLTLRNYREVTLYEVELAKEIVPFFEVSYGSSRYDSRSMGSGEFAAFLLWWRLQRARPKSILLIEEPECFLSPGSQAAFTDLLTQFIVNKKLCAIVTSHSAEIITPLPQESIRFIRRDDAGIRFGTERPSPLLLETIGVRIPIDILVLVEDRAAERLCRRLVEHFDPFLARRMEIVPQDGDGSIINILREVENHYQSLTILGLFDGDVRDSLPTDIRPKALFLPGDRPIERLFKDMCENDQTGFEDFSGLKNVGETLFALESRDHHDWFIEFAKSRGLELGQLFMLLFRFWFQIEDNAREAQSIFEAIRVKVDPDSAKIEEDAPSRVQIGNAREAETIFSAPT
jgi:AAA domain, putative AbiEii toxin, Type IV TA system